MKEGKRKEDTSKYGEFVPSAYNWLPIEEQKQKAKKLANLTKEDKEEKK